MNIQNLKKSFHSRSFRAGTMSIVLMTAVVAVAIVVNLLVSALPSAYTKLDTTSTKLYALSDQVKELIASYQEEITILYIVEEDSKDELVNELLTRAAAANPNIKLQYVDPVLHPEQVSDYTSYSENSFVVRGSKRETVVEYSSVYETLYYYGGEKITASEYQQYYSYYRYGYVSEAPTSERRYAGETALASALQYVTTDEIPVIYTLSGHNEVALDEKLAGYLASDNVDVQTLQLATQSAVPEDAAAVIINVPQADLSEEECTRLSEYVKGGGHVIVYTFYQYGPLDNLHALMESFGLEAVEGLVMETKANMYNSYYYYLYPSIQNMEYTSAISGKYLFAPVCHGIAKTEQTPENVTVTSILETSDASFARQNFDASESATIEKTDSDRSGPFMIGASASYQAGDTTGELTWYSSPYLALTSNDSNGAVADLFLATAESNCSIESSVALATKKIETGMLSVTSSDRVLWGFIMIGLIPLSVIILGLCIWSHRRKR